MSTPNVFLRALEPSDIEALLLLENDTEFWKYANRTEPFSRALLEQHITQQQQQDIFEVKQKRFVLTKGDASVLGFVDLFDFEPLHRRAGVGIIIDKKIRGRGFGKKGITLLGDYARTQLNMHCLYANIAAENDISIKAFKACGYKKLGLKKDWNFYNNHFHDEYLYQKLLA
jgi:diamine N-acetyltransferase